MCDGLVIARSGDVVFAVWKLPATRERFELFERMLEATGREHASFVVCQLILASSAPPNAKLRAHMHAVMRAYEGRLRRVVSVPLGDALWIAVVRVVMRGMALFSGLSATSTTAGSAAEGLDQILAAASEATPPREVLVDAVRAACVALGVEANELGL